MWCGWNIGDSRRISFDNCFQLINNWYDWGLVLMAMSWLRLILASAYNQHTHTETLNARASVTMQGVHFNGMEYSTLSNIPIILNRAHKKCQLVFFYYSCCAMSKSTRILAFAFIFIVSHLLASFSTDAQKSKSNTQRWSCWHKKLVERRRNRTKEMCPETKRVRTDTRLP